MNLLIILYQWTCRNWIIQICFVLCVWDKNSQCLALFERVLQAFLEVFQVFELFYWLRYLVFELGLIIHERFNLRLFLTNLKTLINNFLIRLLLHFLFNRSWCSSQRCWSLWKSSMRSIRFYLFSWKILLWSI